MYWVVNFYLERGIHMHQHEMPAGGPTSRGCVRLIEADAQWVYDWVRTWKATAEVEGRLSAEGQLIRLGTTVLVIGTEPAGVPLTFSRYRGQPTLTMAELPEHPYNVEPGSPQQVWLDKLRADGFEDGKALRNQ